MKVTALILVLQVLTYGTYRYFYIKYACSFYSHHDMCTKQVIPQNHQHQVANNFGGIEEHPRQLHQPRNLH